MTAVNSIVNKFVRIPTYGTLRSVWRNRKCWTQFVTCLLLFAQNRRTDGGMLIWSFENH